MIGLIRTPRGRTVVTTRLRDPALAGRRRRLIEVDVFTEKEARAYLTDALANYLRLADDIHGVGTDLGCLPLALAHAAAYMIGEDISYTTYRKSGKKTLWISGSP